MTENAVLLMVLRPKDEYHKKYVIFIDSPQARALKEPYLELPKGVLDASGRMTGTIVEKMSQELSLKVRKEELINLTSLVIQHPHCRQDRHPDSVIKPAYILPHRPVILWEKAFDRKEIENLLGRFGEQGVLNAKSNFRVLDYSNLWKAGKSNAELMSAWAMYENLNSKGILEQQIRNVRIG